RAESLAGELRGHPDVDDGDVGTVLLDHVEQFVGAGDACHDVDATAGQDPDQALADQQGIIGDGYPHGRSARIVVPWPAGPSMLSRPTASTRSRSELASATSSVLRQAPMSCRGRSHS